MIQGLDDFNGGVVVSRIMEGKVAVVVLLGGSFGEDLEEKFHAVEGTLFPGGEVEG